MTKTFNELEIQNLKWFTSGMFNQTSELRDETDAVIATMKHPRWYSSRVEIEATGNRWTFERKGFWQRKIDVRSIGTGEAHGEFIYELTKGRLELTEGRIFVWKQGSWLGNKWVWTTEEGEPVIGFQTGGIMRMNGQISVDPAAVETKNLSLLIFLGWYLILLHTEDSSAAVASVM